MLEIRPLTQSDIFGALDLIIQFKEEALDKTAVSFNLATLKKRLQEALTGMPVVLVALEEKEVIGIIAALVVNSYFDEKQKMALELMWYVNKEHRGNAAGRQLILAMEEKVKLLGASVFIMIAGHYAHNVGKDDALDIVYRRLGFKLLETHYIKTLGG
jgi:predicted N-acetyltransferase YhbS